LGALFAKSQKGREGAGKAQGEADTQSAVTRDPDVTNEAARAILEARTAAMDRTAAAERALGFAAAPASRVSLEMPSTIPTGEQNTPAPQPDAAWVEAARNAAVRFSDRGRGQAPWRMTTDEFALNSGLRPELARRVHQHQVAIAVARGEPVPRSVLANYPGLAERVLAQVRQARESHPPRAQAQAPEAPSDTPLPGWMLLPSDFVSPGSRKQVDQQLITHRMLVESAIARGDPVPLPVLRVYDLVGQYQEAQNRLAQGRAGLAALESPQKPGQTTPRPQKSTAPVSTEAWKALVGQPEVLVAKVDFQHARITSAERGVGRKSAEAFTETGDPNELYKDSGASANNGESRKLGVFLSPDGSHVLVGTAYENRNHYVTAFDNAGKTRAIRYPALITEGYRQVASLKTTQPTKGYAVTYSATVWQKIALDLRTQKQAARATAAAMEERLRLAGETKRAVRAGNRTDETSLPPSGEDGLREPGDRDLLAEAAAPEPAEPVAFGQAHAETIFGAVSGLGPAALETEFIPAVASTKRTVKAVEAGIKEIIRATGLDPEGALETFKTIVYEAHRSSGGSKEKFTGSIQASLGSERVEPARQSRTQPQGTGSGPARPPAGEASRTKATAPTAAVAAKPAAPARSTRYSERGESPASEYLASGDRVRSTWDSTIAAAQANGLKVSVLQDLHERGVYSPRAVVLAVADPMQPTADNLVLLLHEIGHDVFHALGLPSPMEHAFHQAIAKLATPAGVTPKIAEGADAAIVTAEEVLVERAARNLVAEGFHPAEAQGIAQRLLLFLKRIYLRAAMTIHRSLGKQVNPDLAQKYFEGRLRFFLVGDSSPTLLEWLHLFAGTDADHINMVLAAYANDDSAFRRAHRAAVLAARQAGQPDPEKHVRDSYAASHPLRTAWRDLSAYDLRGVPDIQTPIDRFNAFGAKLGLKPFTGEMVGIAPRTPAPTLDDVRRLAVEQRKAGAQ